MTALLHLYTTCLYQSGLSQITIAALSHLPLAWKTSEPTLGASRLQPHLGLSLQPTTALLHFSFVLNIHQPPNTMSHIDAAEVEGLATGNRHYDEYTGASKPVG